MYYMYYGIKTPSMLFRSMTSNTCLMHGHKQSIMVTRAHFLGHPSPLPTLIYWNQVRTIEKYKWVQASVERCSQLPHGFKRCGFNENPRIPKVSLLREVGISSPSSCRENRLCESQWSALSQHKHIAFLSQTFFEKVEEKTAHGRWSSTVLFGGQQKLLYHINPSQPSEQSKLSHHKSAINSMISHETQIHVYHFFLVKC